MDATQSLQELGFTEYEARAYVALVDAGELNGYALAKATGIPRANIYAVADKLVQRGAARRAEHSAGVVYVPTAPELLLRGIETRQQRVLGDTRQALAQLGTPRLQPAVLNLRGEEVMASARQLVGASRQNLAIAIQPAEAALLADGLRQARDRGVALITLCLEGCRDECGGCAGTVHRCRLAPGGTARWLLVVADAHTALIANFTDAGDAAVLTEHPLVVELADAYIRQSATLATLGNELATRFEGLLSSETVRLLDGLDSTGDFLAHMRELSDAVPPSA